MVVDQGAVSDEEWNIHQQTTKIVQNPQVFDQNPPSCAISFSTSRASGGKRSLQSVPITVGIVYPNYAALSDPQDFKETRDPGGTDYSSSNQFVFGSSILSRSVSDLYIHCCKLCLPDDWMM